jgi:hypothetical protein
MYANRIRQWQARKPSAAARQPSAPAIPTGFVVCPPQLMIAQSWQQEIYRQAYEAAKAASEVPRHYRMLFSVWN